MATKLDRKFVTATLEGVRTLANEVERLECYCAELEKRLAPEQIAEASEAGSKAWIEMGTVTLI